MSRSHSRPFLTAIVAGLSVAGLLGAAGRAFAQEEEVVVVVGIRAVPDIVVVAQPPCTPLPNDPLDGVAMPDATAQQRVIAPDRRGRFVARADDEPVLGPAIWQRAGSAIDHYRFRSRTGRPLCIGAGRSRPDGYAQLRQIVPATAMQDRYVHFTALVATLEAQQVRFWLTAGDRRNRRGMGGDTRAQPLAGTSGWQRIDMVVGPVPAYANHISYGMVLEGRGDVWMKEPRLAVLTREQARGVTSQPLVAFGPLTANGAR